MQLAPLTVEQLSNRFMLEKSPHWWAYRAGSRDVVGKFREEEDYASDEEKLLDGWMQLEELINTHAHGKLKVVLKKNKSDNLDKSITLHVKWGAAPGRAGAGIGASTSYAPAFAPNPNDMLLQMLTMQEKNFERQEASREAAHAREMATMQQLLEAKFTAQSLEAEIEGMGGSSISEDLLRGFIDVAKTMVMRPAAPAALGTIGQGSNEQIPSPEMPPPPPAAEEKPGHRQFSVDLALRHIAVIRKNIPDYHVNDVIEALALYTQEQPEQAKQMLGMLMPNKG